MKTASHSLFVAVWSDYHNDCRPVFSRLNLRYRSPGHNTLCFSCTTVHIKTTTIAISNTESHAVTTLSCTAFLFLNSSRCVRLSGVGVNTERCQRMSVYLQKYVSVCVPMLTPRCQCPHKMVPVSQYEGVDNEVLMSPQNGAMST